MYVSQPWRDVPGVVETGSWRDVLSVVETGSWRDVPGVVETGSWRDVPGVVETGSCGHCLNLLANSSTDVVVANRENDGAWRWF